MTDTDLDGKDHRAIHEKIREALQQFRTGIRKSDKSGLASALRSLDRLTEEHKRDLDPQLVHFLQRRSYEKAWAFLNGEGNIPAGICGGRR